jgi:hypothetical protein
LQLFYKDDDKAKYVKIVCPGNKTSQDSTGDPLNSTIGHREKQCTGTQKYNIVGTVPNLFAKQL